MRLFSSLTFSLSSPCSFSPRAFFLHFSPFSSSSSRNVRVSLWWDFENCNLPAGVNVCKVLHFISRALRVHGIKGPLQITAFGDTSHLPRDKQEALSSTGVTLTHIPQDGKNSADRFLLVDLMHWVSQNPPPAHVFLISGDRDFTRILHLLRMKNYNVLLACPESTPGILCSAASIMWHWNALIRGENLVGKHFNQPPDGPYGSWYGHYKAPLEDPFLVNGQSSSLLAKEVSKLNSDPKLKSCSGHVTTCSSDSLGEAKSEPMSQDANSVHPVLVASAHYDKFSSNPGLLRSIRNRFKFQGTDTEKGRVSEHCYDQNQLKNQFSKRQLFSCYSFWQDMQSFMETPKGVEIISRSKTRLEMAENLLVGGPLVLKFLSTSEVLDFLELLIVDKKWVEECPVETIPFKLTLSTAKKSSYTKPFHHCSTPILMNKVSQPSLQGSLEHDSGSDEKKKIPQKTKSEIFHDCKNLVDMILREHPKGYNMGTFKEQFLKKYGYQLDFKKLGYSKLASFLQTMPGVTTTSTFVVLTSKAPKV